MINDKLAYTIGVAVRVPAQDVAIVIGLRQQMPLIDTVDLGRLCHDLPEPDVVRILDAYRNERRSAAAMEIAHG